MQGLRRVKKPNLFMQELRRVSRKHHLFMQELRRTEKLHDIFMRGLRTIKNTTILCNDYEK